MASLFLESVLSVLSRSICVCVCRRGGRTGGRGLRSGIERNPSLLKTR